MKIYILKVSSVVAVILLFASTSSFAQSDLSSSSVLLNLSRKDIALKKELLNLDPLNPEHIAKGAIFYSQNLREGPQPERPEGPQPEGQEGPQPEGQEGPQPEAQEGPQPEMQNIESSDVSVDEVFFGKLKRSIMTDWDKVTIRGTRTVVKDNQKHQRFFIRTFTIEDGRWKISSWVEMNLKE